MMMITSAKQTGDKVEILVYGLQTKQAGMPPVTNCPGPITVDLCDISTAIITGLKFKRKDSGGIRSGSDKALSSLVSNGRVSGVFSYK